MKALITGSAGFVGRHMAGTLIRRGYDVTGVDVAPGRFGWQADMLAYLPSDRETYDLVVHAAAWTPHRAAIDSNPRMHLNNRLLDATLLHWAVRTGQPRVLYFSSCAVLDSGPPLDEYARTKLAGEQMAATARACGTGVTVVRPYSGYGADQSEDFPFRAFVERAKRREDPFVIWGDGRQVRDWIHIDDVVQEALLAVESGTEDPVSLCTGIGTSMGDLAALMCEEAGYHPGFKHTGTSGGAPRRVGVPAFRRRKITIAEGVRRAFHG
jgi:nucleoside-diphosphate-sugar epimerase